MDGPLTDLSVRLGALWRREEAPTAIHEAVGIYPELAARWPERTATGSTSRCKSLPGLSTAKTSAAHLRGSLRPKLRAPSASGGDCPAVMT